MLTVLVALLALWFGFWLGRQLYRATEGLLQGVVGGCALFWRMAHWTIVATCRGLYRASHVAHRLDTELGQRVHAACWVWSFWLKRAYIASQLRARRRAFRN